MVAEQLIAPTWRFAVAAVRTLGLAGLSAVCGVLLAMPVALARDSRARWPRLIAALYVFLFRGIPAFVLLFFLYFGCARLDWVREGALWHVLGNAWWCAVIALTLNTSAYTAEIIRGGLRAVPEGTLEAARALALSRFQVLRSVHLPLAFRLALPAYGNELVLLLKATSIASAITVLDVMGEAKMQYAQTYDPFVPLLCAAVIYLVLVRLIAALMAFVSHRLSPVPQG